MFPGQGVQRQGMGEDLFERFPRLVDRANDILGYSVRDLCLSDPAGRLSDSRFSQPAIYVVNALAYRAEGLRGDDFDVLLGHSLGEYNALEAAGYIGFEAGLELVRARAEATAKCSGAMLAVVGLELRRVHAVLRHAGLDEVETANVNSRFQTVLGGPDLDIGHARSALVRAGARIATRLPVTGAYHTRHMAAAIAPFSSATAAAPFRRGHTPVVANRTARPHDASLVRRDLVDHLTSPVLWQQSVEWILDTHGDPDLPNEGVDFQEAGATRVLTRLVSHIRRDRGAPDHD
ncbi:hypothetical protein ADL05_23170 [Nocardiopsis sp. NRRL B-16309]|nr:hypothetical protein ADL05_23170 [Nocardiopsis sp. NRRL B-16309]